VLAGSLDGSSRLAGRAWPQQQQDPGSPEWAAWAQGDSGGAYAPSYYSPYHPQQPQQPPRPYTPSGPAAMQQAPGAYWAEGALAVEGSLAGSRVGSRSSSFTAGSARRPSAAAYGGLPPQPLGPYGQAPGPWGAPGMHMQQPQHPHYQQPYQPQHPHQPSAYGYGHPGGYQGIPEHQQYTHAPPPGPSHPLPQQAAWGGGGPPRLLIPHGSGASSSGPFSPAMGRQGSGSLPGSGPPTARSHGSAPSRDLSGGCSRVMVAGDQGDYHSPSCARRFLSA